MFVLSFSLLRGFDLLLKSYTNNGLTILERQFRLSGSESGLFAILNDLAQVSLVVFVSYFGYKYHRPRVIGVGFMIQGKIWRFHVEDRSGTAFHPTEHVQSNQSNLTEKEAKL